jgi:hypothetical protein
LLRPVRIYYVFNCDYYHVLANHGLQAHVGTVVAVIEFDFEKQILAPVLLALAVEMQRRSCASSHVIGTIKRK